MFSSLLFYGLVACALILFYIFYSIWQSYKLKQKVRLQFGAIPPVHTGRLAAESYWRSHAEASPSIPWVDDITWQDLDMDLVFSRLAGGYSGVGDAWLYQQLRSPLAASSKRKSRQDLLGFFNENLEIREKVAYALARLGRPDGIDFSVVAFHAQALAKRRHWPYRLLALLPLGSIPLLLLHWVWAVFWLLGSLLLNLIVSLRFRHRNQLGFVSVRSLASALVCARRIARLLDGAGENHAQKLRDAARPFSSFSRSYGMLELDEMFQNMGLLCPFSLVLLPVLSYLKIVRELPQKQRQIIHLLDAVGEMDGTIAILSVRQSLPFWCRPAFGGPSLRFQTLYHPLLDQAVPNSGSFDASTLFTGSNASGKSTFIKALALNCLLAQAIDTCTAHSFALQPGAVATSMAVADSVVDGDSYFVAEIKSMRRLVQLREGGQRAYLFIDEILKGTNTVERIAASASVLRYLAGGAVLVFAATHDWELVGILGPIFLNFHFQEQFSEGEISFDYKLYPGPAHPQRHPTTVGLQFPPGGDWRGQWPGGIF